MDARYDTRDEIEVGEVSDILDYLPEDHAARVAFARGADTIALTHLVADMVIVDRLKEAWLAGYRRMLERAGGHFRP